MRFIVVMILAIAVVGSAMGVTVLKHDARQTFAALQVANETRDQALTEWSRLQLELASLAELGRVERAAKAELNMGSPQKTEVVIEMPPSNIGEEVIR
jgi:cell division protein FtsL